MLTDLQEKSSDPEGGGTPFLQTVGVYQSTWRNIPEDLIQSTWCITSIPDELVIEDIERILVPRFM
jgi:hypothetical protein